MGLTVRMALPLLRPPNPRFAPILDGEVSLDGVDLDVVVDHPPNLLVRHLEDDSFDVFDYSLAGYLLLQDRPQWRHLEWTALPVFLTKVDLQYDLYVAAESPITGLGDLAGRRAGTPDFLMTASVWLRIILRELHGIDPSTITWVDGRSAHERHSSLITAGDEQPHSATVEELPPGASLQGLLETGALDVAFGDHTLAQVVASAAVRPLLDADQIRQISHRFAATAGTVPFNHVMVVRRRLVEAHPDVVCDLYDLFERSKRVAYSRALEAAAGYLLQPQMAFAGQADEIGEDPYPSGVAANRDVIALLVDQLHREGLLRRAPDPSELFAEPVRDT